MGVNAIAIRRTVKDNSNASLDTPKRAGPHVDMIATDVQFMAVQAVMKTAVKTWTYFFRRDQLKGF
jgi:hypothetical protein